MVDSVLNIILNFLKKGTGAKDAAEAVKKTGEETEKAAKKTKGFNLQQAAAKLGLAAFTKKLLEQIPQMANLGFKYRNAQIALAAYAGSAEKATAITDAVTEASGFAISKFAAVTNATRLLSLGLASNADEAAQFTKTAITLGATMGKDVQGAFEEFTLLLANQSILRLDTYGISGAKVREEMARLAAEFPELDRSARFTNATMTIAAEKMDKLEEAGFEATSSIDRLGAVVENLKISAAEFVAEGVLPVADGLTGVADATKAANEKLAKGVDTFEDYKIAIKEAGTGLNVLEKLALKSGELSEAQFEAVKSAQALAEAGTDLTVVQEEVILTTGGINELLQEQVFLSKALSLGMGGTLTKAYEKAEEGAADFEETQKDLEKEGGELFLQWQELQIEIDKLNASVNAGGIANEEYRIQTEALNIKQGELNARLNEGAISQEKYRNESEKLTLRQAALDETFGGVQKSVEELKKEQDGLLDQTDKLQEKWDAAEAKSLDLAEALEKTTAELIFQAAAAELDAETSLLLARELGLVDEATFAVAQEAQRLRIVFDETEQSAEDFATEVGILKDRVDELTSKNITITADTLQAQQRIANLSQSISALPVTHHTSFGTFQEGGQFQIPDKGPFGDRVPVSFMAERGETVTITPRDGGGAGARDVSITNHISSDIDLAFFQQQLEEILA